MRKVSAVRVALESSVWRGCSHQYDRCDRAQLFLNASKRTSLIH